MTLLCADGELKLEGDAARMVFHSSRIIAVNEKRVIVAEFANFLKETDCRVDVL